MPSHTLCVWEDPPQHISRSTNADATLAVHPFTGEPIITHSLARQWPHQPPPTQAGQPGHDGQPHQSRSQSRRSAWGQTRSNLLHTGLPERRRAAHPIRLPAAHHRSLLRRHTDHHRRKRRQTGTAYRNISGAGAWRTIAHRPRTNRTAALQHRIATASCMITQPHTPLAYTFETPCAQHSARHFERYFAPKPYFKIRYFAPKDHFKMRHFVQTGWKMLLS